MSPERELAKAIENAIDAAFHNGYAKAADNGTETGTWERYCDALEALDEAWFREMGSKR